MPSELFVLVEVLSEWLPVVKYVKHKSVLELLIFNTISSALTFHCLIPSLTSL